MHLPDHKTKIVATVGPASSSGAVLEAMIRAGMDAARLNFSHGEFAEHARIIENVRGAAAAAGRRVAVLADLPGPKLRIGTFAAQAVMLAAGDRFTLTTEDVAGDEHRVSISFPRLPEVVKPGDLLFLADGTVQLEAAEVRGLEVVCIVRVGGELRARKGLNLPGIDLGVSAFTERDHACLEFALAHGVDAVSQSFVESAKDVDAVRRAARALGGDPLIFAKIERARALDRLDEILAASDGVMIARGDLGVEVPIERIALIQKDIIRRANRAAIPVITATQMLESMTTNRLPTRAEATDVSNAVLDGTDCVMLSGESAIGLFPVESVAMLAKIAAVVEPARRRVPVRELAGRLAPDERAAPEHLTALAVEASLERVTPAAVLSPTRSGSSARRMASLHLPAWVFGVCADEAICRQLQFSYGVAPVFEPAAPSSWSEFARRIVRESGLSGAVAFLIQGPSAEHPDGNHRFEVVPLE